MTTAPPLCQQCGSVRTRFVRGQRFESFIARLLKQRLVACGRCGWRGRMKVDSDAPAPSRRVLTYPSDIPPVDDQDEPDLAKLDKALEKATNLVAPKKRVKATRASQK